MSDCKPKDVIPMEHFIQDCKNRKNRFVLQLDKDVQSFVVDKNKSNYFITFDDIYDETLVSELKKKFADSFYLIKEGEYWSRDTQVIHYIFINKDMVKTPYYFSIYEDSLYTDADSDDPDAICITPKTMCNYDSTRDNNSCGSMHTIRTPIRAPNSDGQNKRNKFSTEIIRYPIKNDMIQQSLPTIISLTGDGPSSNEFLANYKVVCLGGFIDHYYNSTAIYFVDKKYYFTRSGVYVRKDNKI